MPTFTKREKTPVDRIQYYTRKAAQFSRKPHTSGSTRFNRLQVYKALLLEELQP